MDLLSRRGLKQESYRNKSQEFSSKKHSELEDHQGKIEQKKKKLIVRRVNFTAKT